jgi:hypothetical protein
VIAAVGVDWALPLLWKLRRERVKRTAPGPPLRIPTLGIRGPLRAFLALGFLLFTMRGALWVLTHHQWCYRIKQPHSYLTPAVRGLFDHLSREGGPAQVALGGSITGGWTAVLTDTRAYWGHWHMTLNEPEKHALRDWFFTRPGDGERKARWLREAGIDWVILWPVEWQDKQKRKLPPELIRTSVAGVPGLHPVYVTPEITLLRVL